jgi:transcriptional regulator with XRE-family HTH domain
VRSGQHAGDRDDDELARSLRALRAAAALDQVPAAKAAGIGQATLSRAEHGQAVLRPDKLGRLLDIYGVTSDDERSQLIALARLKREERVDSRVILQAGPHHVQRRIRELEESAGVVRGYQPGAVFGVAQTPEYMRAVFSQRGAAPADVEQRVSERRLRRALLDQPEREWILIQTEGALRWHLHSPEVMAAQLTDLVETSRRPNVHLGIVDWRVPTSILGMHGFHVYDDHTVVVGTRDGTAFFTDSQKVDLYRQHFDQLQAAAVFGERARVHLAEVAHDYRDLIAHISQ